MLTKKTAIGLALSLMIFSTGTALAQNNPESVYSESQETRELTALGRENGKDETVGGQTQNDVRLTLGDKLREIMSASSINLSDKEKELIGRYKTRARAYRGKLMKLLRESHENGDYLDISEAAVDNLSDEAIYTVLGPEDGNIVYAETAKLEDGKKITIMEMPQDGKIVYTTETPDGTTETRTEKDDGDWDYYVTDKDGKKISDNRYENGIETNYFKDGDGNWVKHENGTFYTKGANGWELKEPQVSNVDSTSNEGFETTTGNQRGDSYSGTTASGTSTRGNTASSGETPKKSGGFPIGTVSLIVLGLAGIGMLFNSAKKKGEDAANEVIDKAVKARAAKSSVLNKVLGPTAETPKAQNNDFDKLVEALGGKESEKKNTVAN